MTAPDFPGYPRRASCPRCRGDAYIEVPRIDADGERYEAAYPCPECLGLGYITDKEKQ